MSVVNIHVVPKSETINRGKHRIILSYNPNAVAGKRWEWTLCMVRNYTYRGSASSIEQSRADADQFLALADSI